MRGPLGVLSLRILLAVAAWAIAFFGVAYAVVQLVERVNGPQSECRGVNCGTVGNVLYNHDLLATVMLAAFALVPGAAVFRMSRRFLGKRS